MRNKCLAVFLTAILLTAPACGWWSRGDPAGRGKEEAGDHAEVHGDEHAAGDRIVRLTGEQLKLFGIETAVAAPGRMRIELALTGEVALNADRVAHVAPRVSGVVSEVRKNLGDRVRRGEVMAVLESRELADSTAALLAARERVALAQANFAREEQLWQKRIAPEQDYIQARNALAESNIELRTAEHKLLALGFSDRYVSQLSHHQGKETILYEMTAPFDATVIEKHISLGEVLKDESAAFLIADLSTVWVNLDVHQKDLTFIQVGQTAVIGAGDSVPAIRGRVSFLEPVARETNRTVHARVVVPNSDGRWRPGLFVTGRIAVDEVNVPVLAPGEALILFQGKTCVFVLEGDGFRLQPVAPGKTDGVFYEIASGLAAGQVYVVKGAFTLKSELEKPEVEH